VAERPERADGDYQGTVAVNVAVAARERERELVLVAVDVWDHATVLRGTATIDRADPFWLPHAWAITTDDGTDYTRGGSGATSMQWTVEFAPAVPRSARRLGVFVGPDGVREPGIGSLPDQPTLVVPLAGWPTSPHHAPASLDLTAELGPPVGRMPNFEGQSVRPEGVLPVSARLDDVAGRDLSVLSIERYPTWFFLHLGGTGALPSAVPGEAMGRLRRCWTAEDDRGGRYQGTIKSSHGGFPWVVDVPFVPALDPQATGLALAFPNPFGPGVVRTSVDLPAVASRSG
jgi:hypothetical protein